MLQASRTTIRGPTFIRLLAGLTDLDVQQPKQLPSDQLSQWLDLNNAIALSAALESASPAAPSADAPGTAGEAECARVRATLAAAIAADRAFDAASTASDFAFFRQRCLALQQTMEAGIGQLRARLRGMLAAGPAGMARLAAVDAAMERALGRRERSLLARVPALLGQHHARLLQCAGNDAAAAAPGPWLQAFRKDMQRVLLAELDVRLQPVEGLLSALRTRQLEPHVQEPA